MKSPLKNGRCIVCNEEKSEYGLLILNVPICRICEDKIVKTDPWNDNYNNFVKACKQIWQQTEDCLYQC